MISYTPDKYFLIICYNNNKFVNTNWSWRIDNGWRYNHSAACGAIDGWSLIIITSRSALPHTLDPSTPSVDCHSINQGGATESTGISLNTYITNRPIDTLAQPTSDVPRQHPPKEYNNSLLASTRQASWFSWTNASWRRAQGVVKFMTATVSTSFAGKTVWSVSWIASATVWPQYKVWIWSPPIVGLGDC